MLLALRDSLPELYPYGYAAYAYPSLLFYGLYKVWSNEGPQEGDPIGPLLFCNTVQPLLESLQSELPLGHLDDFTLGGEQSVVAKDVVAEIGQTLGFTLNISKCELTVTFSASRVQHLLCGSPSVGHAALGSLNELLCTALSYLTNCYLSDSEWIQASLHVRDGGIGVRRVSMLALPAFLASAASTLSLQDEILFECHCQPDDPLVD